MAPTAASFGTKPLNSWALSLGAGNKFNNWFRGDVTFEMRGGASSSSTSSLIPCITDVAGVSTQTDPVQKLGYFAIESQCREVQSASLHRMSGLANFYVDLGTFAGVSPYVGAGLGMTTMKTEGSYDWRVAGDGSKYNPTLVRPADFPPYWLDKQGNQLTVQPDISWGAQDRAKSVGQRVYNATWAVMAGVAVDVSSHAKIDLGYRFLNFGKVGTGASAISTAHEMRVGIRYMVD